MDTNGDGKTQRKAKEVLCLPLAPPQAHLHLRGDLGTDGFFCVWDGNVVGLEIMKFDEERRCLDG